MNCCFLIRENPQRHIPIADWNKISKSASRSKIQNNQFVLAGSISMMRVIHFVLSTHCSKLETRTQRIHIWTFFRKLHSFFALPIVKRQRQILESEFHSMLALCGRHTSKNAQIHSILLSKCHADAARRHYSGGDNSFPAGGERRSQRRKRSHGTGMYRVTHPLAD